MVLPPGIEPGSTDYESDARPLCYGSNDNRTGDSIHWWIGWDSNPRGTFIHQIKSLPSSPLDAPIHFMYTDATGRRVRAVGGSHALLRRGIVGCLPFRPGNTVRFHLVRAEGLEPPRREASDFESDTSTIPPRAHLVVPARIELATAGFGTQNASITPRNRLTLPERFELPTFLVETGYSSTELRKQKDGDPDRIRTYNPQIRNLVHVQSCCRANLEPRTGFEPALPGLKNQCPTPFRRSRLIAW